MILNLKMTTMKILSVKVEVLNKSPLPRPIKGRRLSADFQADLQSRTPSERLNREHIILEDCPIDQEIITKLR